MIIHHIGENNSILNKFIAEIRDASIQKDSLRFRRNIERIGEVLGYELSKFVRYNNKSIITPLGIKNIHLPTNKIVICSILRAGLPLHQGLLNYFDDSENAFISAYRHHPNQDNNFEIKVEYFAAPSLKGKTLLLADPMLATGQSLVAVYEAIKKQRVIDDIHIVAIIASTEGIDFIKSHFPEHTHLWIAAIDDQLDRQGLYCPWIR